MTKRMSLEKVARDISVTGKIPMVANWQNANRQFMTWQAKSDRTQTV
ncbi:hypothetical protein [Thalassobius vesicularis]|nr:hypothetical protein [Thalassobius vesicularis]